MRFIIFKKNKIFNRLKQLQNNLNRPSIITINLIQFQ